MASNFERIPSPPSQNTFLPINTFLLYPLNLTMIIIHFGKYNFFLCLVGDLLGYVDDTSSPRKDSPNYIIWFKEDQFVLTRLISSITEFFTSFTRESQYLLVRLESCWSNFCISILNTSSPILSTIIIYTMRRYIHQYLYAISEDHCQQLSYN